MSGLRLSRLLAAAACVAGAACSEGYPTDSPAQRPPTPEERLQVMQRAIRANASEVRSIALRECSLEVRWKNQARTAHALVDAEAVVETDAATRHFRIVLLDRKTGVRSPLLLSTPDWVEMAQVRGELNQLRAACVPSAAQAA